MSNKLDQLHNYISINHVSENIVSEISPKNIKNRIYNRELAFFGK